MPRKDLKHANGWYAIGGALIAAVVIVSLIPVTLETDIDEGDKLAHVLVYGALMYWFGMLASTARARFAWAIALAGLGVALEYAQGMTGYRSFEVLDMAANATGVAIGWAVSMTPAGTLLAWVDARMGRETLKGGRHDAR